MQLLYHPLSFTSVLTLNLKTIRIKVAISGPEPKIFWVFHTSLNSISVNNEENYSNMELYIIQPCMAGTHTVHYVIAFAFQKLILKLKMEWS